MSGPKNSTGGIKLSLDTTLNNPPSLNILRPAAVLMQYFGKNISSNEPLDNEEMRHTHDFCCGASLIGMDKYIFVTRKMIPSTEKVS